MPEPPDHGREALRARTLESRFGGLLEAAPDAMVIVDRDGRIALINSAVETLFGFTRAELLGRSVEDLVPDRFRDAHPAHRTRYTDDPRRRPMGAGIELFGRRKDGSEFPAEISLSPIEVEDERLTIAALRDVTARKKSETKFRGLLEAAPDAMVIVDRDGRIVLINGQAERLFGYSREELLGRPVEDLVPSRFHQGHPAHRTSYFLNPRPRPMGGGLALAGRRKDGSEFPVEISLSPVETEDGTLVTAAVRNITEQKRLEEQVRQRNRELTETSAFLANVLDSSTEYSIIAMDLELSILTWNEGARRNYGWTAEEMVGRKSSYLIHVPEDVQSGRAQALLDDALRTGKAEGVFERVRKDGERFPASVAVTLRKDVAGVPVGYLLISKDITTQKTLEEQLRRKNEELEEQNRRVQETSRLKSEFLANMSHELRTPLNAIIGFTEMMHDGKVGPIADQQKEFLGDILTSSRHLLQLINDVLDLAKVESGKMEFRAEPVDLTRIVGEVRDILRSLAAAKRIPVQVAVAPSLAEVVTDPGKLKQVLYNYLSNALKFTPEGGRVAVRLAPEDEARFRLEVEDSGIGITAEDQARLFVEFQQLDASATKKYPGTGLGLALTKRVVEAQGGSVGVQSLPGRGSTFWAVLPRRLSEAPLVLLPAAPAGGASVLVVEDDPREREWLVRTFSGAGYSVESVALGAEAVRRAREQAFDAITLDLLLPDLAGREVLREIRASDRNRETPVIVVTVVAEKGVVTGFQVHEIFTKPVTAEDLIASLERASVQRDGKRPILIVDDDPQALKLAEGALKQLGFRPICCASGADGLDAAARELPAAVVLDFLMPGMNGSEFLTELRRRASGHKVPVIVWTVKDLSSEERRRVLAMAQGVVPKGVGTQALLDELRAFVPAPGRARHGA